MSQLCNLAPTDSLPLHQISTGQKREWHHDLCTVIRAAMESVRHSYHGEAPPPEEFPDDLCTNLRAAFAPTCDMLDRSGLRYISTNTLCVVTLTTESLWVKYHCISSPTKAVSFVDSHVRLRIATAR